MNNEDPIVELLQELPAAFKQSKLAKRVGTILLILLGGLLVAGLLIALQPKAPKVKAHRVAAPVSILELSPETKQAEVRGFGTVTPFRELPIRPQVSGTIVEIAPSFQQGGRIQKDELLFKVDPRDYEIALQEATAQLERALFELKLEEGNQLVAKREWELLKEGLGRASVLSEELALRKPHLRDKKAQVEAARSAVRKAELDLERTKVLAPFNAVVIDEDIEIGRYVSPQENVSTIAATDLFQIEVQISRAELQWIPELLEGKNAAIPAIVYQRVQDGVVARREAKAIRLLGDVDTAGRMARVLVLVENPLEVGADADAQLPLLIGSYVEVALQGKQIEKIYVVPRKAIREGNELWLVSDKNTLHSVSVKTIFSTAQTLYVRGDLPKNAKVITNTLPGALEGMPVSIQESEVS